MLNQASMDKLNQVIAYLNEKSNQRLWARLYQKIIFLIELEFYKKHQRLFIGVNFKSYFYGPYSEDIARALDNFDKIEISQCVKDKVDEVLEPYNFKKFDNKHQEQGFQRIIDYIHSLYIYQMTPFEASFDFSLYDFKDLFKTQKTGLNRKELETEKSKNAKIELEAKKYEHLFYE